MTRPLEGVLVVSLEQAVSAPLTTRHLADLGAEVLKIERPGGDSARHYDTNLAGQSTFFVWANYGKQSLVIDLTSPSDRGLFDELVAGADVFVQNLSPGAAQRAGVLASQLCERYPSLIACDISGYGLDGPRSDDKAYDLAIQAEAAAIDLTGSADEMSKVGFSIADISVAMYALSSILAALLRRQRSGEGAVISLSMLECLAEWTAVPVYSAVATGSVPARSPRRHSLIAPYGIFDLCDGSRVLIAVQAEHEWLAFASQVLQRPDLVDEAAFTGNAARIANVVALEAVIDEVLAATPAGVILQRLRHARVAHSFVNDPIELWQHSQLRARQRFQTVDLPTGQAEIFKPPFNISDNQPRNSAVPALGEHEPALIERLLADQSFGVESERGSDRTDQG